jgi:transcription initiation factor TFIIB
MLYKDEFDRNPIKELSKITSLNRKTIFATYKRLKFSKEIQRFCIETKEEKMKKQIYNLATSLDLPMDLKKSLFLLFKKITLNNNFSGKDPRGIIAALAYYACKKKDIKKSQKEIADISGITEVTLRNRYKEIFQTIPI